MPEPYEELEVWREARALVSAFYGATSRGGFHRDLVLRDKLRGGIVDVVSAVAVGGEGGASGGATLLAAAARCSELGCLLIVAADLGYLDEVEAGGLRGQLDELARALRARARQQPDASRDRARSEPEAASGGWR